MLNGVFTVPTFLKCVQHFPTAAKTIKHLTINNLNTMLEKLNKNPTKIDKLQNESYFNIWDAIMFVTT